MRVPKIGRLLRLDSGVRAQFHQSFSVEDKVHGYNVRVSSRRGRVLAVIRQGRICPFTTDRIHDLVDTRVFDAWSDDLGRQNLEGDPVTGLHAPCGERLGCKPQKQHARPRGGLEIGQSGAADATPPAPGT